MPTIQNTSRGQVVQIWGKAYIRGTDGVWRPLALGEVVPQGAEILTEQDAIVMMSRDEKPLPVIAPAPALPADLDRAITALDSGKTEDAPAAGLAGGGGGDLQPGLRIERIVETVTPATLVTALDTNAVQFGLATRSDPAAAAEPPRLIVASSSIAAVEAGASVNLGLRAPSGDGTNGAALTITVTSVPTIGQVVTANGTPVVAGSVLDAADLAGLTYVPPADYSAGTPVGPFAYSVSNGSDSASGGTQIAVTPVNDAPLADDAGFTGNEDVLIDVGLSGRDVDGTVTRFVVATLPANGTLLLADTLTAVSAGQSLTPAQAATLLFRPAANWNGSTSFTFSAVDNEGAASAPATITLNVSPLNDAPLAVNDSASTVAQAPVTVAVLGNDSDADNDALAVTGASVSPALGSVVVNGDGTLTFTAAAGVTGPVAITYTIADPSGATASATLTVNVAAAPSVSVDAPALTNDRTPTLVGTSNLPQGSTVTLTVTDANGTVQTFTTPVRPDGTYSVDVPAALAEGPYTAVASVSGPGGSSATANDSGVVDVTPPTITVDAPALTSDATPPLTGSTDLPAGSTVTLTVTGANGVAQLFTATVQAGGTFAIDVPAALVNGPFAVQARGTDAAGNSATASDDGIIDNIAPVINVDAPALTRDTTPALVGSTDLPAGSVITLTVTGANGAVQTVTATVQADGSYAADVPAALVEGNFSVVARGTDAAGNSASASDSGVIDTTAPTLTIDAPALTNDTTPPLTGSTNLPAGATVSLTVTGANGATQTFTAVVQAGGGFSVDVPAALVQGTFNVTATATDAAGNSASASDSGVIDTTPPLATIAIDPVTADNVVNAGEAGGSVTLTGTVGGDVRVGDTVTLNVNGVNYTGLVLAGNSFAIAVPGSAVLADADRRVDGSVTTTDAAGNSATATAQRSYAVNSAPIAVDDALSVGEDTASAGGDVTPGTAAQDRDADGDALTVTGVAAGVQPSASGNVATPIAGAWGTLLLDGLGAYTYAPSVAAQSLDAGQTVTDTFTYTIADGRGGSATATLTISVVGADDPTTISGVFIGTVTEDAVASASGVLASDDPDVGARPFVAQSNSAGTYGTFSIDAAGNWNYTLTNAAANVQALAQGQSVTETFVVATDDGTTASITVTVRGTNDAPVVSSTSINAVEEGAAVALGLAAPSDVDNGAVLAITVTGLPTIGQVQLAGGSAVSNGDTLTAAQLAGLRYLPPTDYDGTAPVGAFTYQVSDGLATVSGGTTITVAPVNDRPLAFDASAGVAENATLAASVPAATDVDGSVTGYTLVGGVGAGNGSLAFNSDGTYSFATGNAFDALAAGQTRQVSFTYTATDNQGAVSTPATVTITVTGANNAPTGADATYTIAEDGSRSFAGADFGFSDIDAGDTLAAVRIDAIPGSGTLTLGGVAVTAGQLIAAAQLASLVFTPAADASGSPYASFTFSVQDSGGLFDAAPNTITLNVTPVNDPPLAVATPAAGDEDTPIAVSLGGSDIDGSIAAVTVTALPADGILFLADGTTPVLANAALTPAQAASLVFVPAADFNGSASVTFTVTDNSGATSAPAVTPITVAPVVDPVISIDDVSVNEAAGTMTFTVSLSAPTTATVAVNYASANGSATAGSDYTAASGTLTFAAGVTSQTVTVAIAEDAISEGNETFTVTLSAPVNATIGDGLGIGTLIDNDGTPTLTVSSQSVGEGAGFAVFTVSLSNPSATDTTVGLALANGSASGADFGPGLEVSTNGGASWSAASSATIAAGTTSLLVRTPVVADTLDELNETFTLGATVTAGSTTNASATGTATITDDDPAPTLAIDDVSVNEGAGTATFTVTLSAASGLPVSVGYATSNGSATAPADYTAISGTLAFAPGVTSQTVTVAIANDTLFEGNETFNVTLSAPVNATVADGLGVATIVDNDAAPTIAAVSSPTVTEGSDLVYAVTLSNASSTPTTFAYSLGGGSASAADIGTPTFSNGVTLAAGVLTVPAGVSGFSVTLPTTQDALDENSETVPLAIGGVSGTGTIVDDDATPSLAIDNVSVNEGAGTMTFTVTLSAASGLPVSVGYATGSGTATAGADYTAGSGTLSFAAGVTSQTVTVAIAEDTVFEGNETLNVTLSGATNATIGTATGIGTIVDNDAAPTVASVSSPTVVEGTDLVYTVTLSNASAAATTFAYTLGGGSAAAADVGTPTFSNGVTLAAGVLTVPAGVTSFQITLPTTQDLLDEANETVPVTVGGVGGTGTITDDDAAPSLSINDVTVDEAAGTMSFTVTLSAPSGQGVAVDYATGNVTAVAGADYTAASGTLTFAPGVTSQTVTIAIAEDTVFEGNETLNVTLSAPVNAVLADGLGVGTLTDNDGAPSLAVSSPTVAETGGHAEFTLTLSNPSATAISVNLALANGSANGADYGAGLEVSTDGGATWTSATSATFAAGATSVLVRTPVADDSLDEIDETFTLTATRTAGSTSNASATGTATITDDDATPSLSIGDVSVNEAAGTMTFTVTLSAASGQAVSVGYATANGSATAPADYAAGNGTLTFAPGVTSQTVTVAIAEDTVFEGNETFSVTLSAPVNATIGDGLGIGTIIDNDGAPTLTVGSPTVAEGGGFAVFTLALSNPSATATTVGLALANGSAAGADYGPGLEVSTDGGATWSAAASATFAAGATSVLARTPIANDALDEIDETFTLTATRTAGSTSNASAVGTATITDDDATPTLSINNVTVNEAAGTATFTVTLSAASGQTVSVGYDSSNGTASAGSDYSALLPGSLTFAPGVTSQTVTVAIAEDTVFEGSETFNVNLTAPSNATIADGLGVGTIVDNDAAPTITAVSSPTAVEGGDLVYAVTLSNASSSATTFAYTLGGGSAVAADLGTPSFSNGVTLAAGVLTVPAGVTGFSITLPTTQDTLDEASETVPVSVGGVAGIGTITDDDPTPSLAIDNVSVNESAGTMTFTVTLSAASGQGVSVNYASGNVTATAGADYAAASGTLTFAPGVTSQTVTIALAEDTVFEGNETLNVTLSGAVNASIATATGVGTIIDNDAAPTLAVSSPTVAEGAGFAQFTVSLSNPSATATSVSLALANGSAGGADYGPGLEVSTDGGATWTPATTATFAAGATSLLARTPIANDALDESDETFTLTATRTGGSTGNASAAGTATITDDDATPSLAISGPVSINEAAGTATYTVTLSAASGQVVSVGYGTAAGTATAGADYTTTAGTLTFAPGVTSQTFSVPILNDGTYEGAETFTLALSSPSNATIATGAVTSSILDDGTGSGGSDNDSPSLSVSSPTVAEGGGFAVFSVSLSNASTQATTFSLATASGTATSGSDFGATLQVSTDGGSSWTAAGSATIAAGATSVLVRAPITGDTIDEADETFTLTATRTAGTTSNAAATGTATITDDDAAPTIASVSAASAVEATSLVHTVTLSNASASATTYTLSFADGSATGGGIDYSATLANAAFSNGVTIVGGTITVPAGVTTFTVTVPSTADTIDEADETYTLTVGAASGTGTIVDDDAAPTVSSVTAATQVEGVTLVHTVTLSNASSSATSFAYSLGGGSATGGGTDYTTPPTFSNGVTLAAGVLTVPAGVTSFTVGVPTTLDTIDEGAAETYNLSVGGVTALGTITDDDNAPTIASVSSPTATEGSDLVYAVTLSNASSSATSFAYTLGGGTASAADIGTPTFSNGVTLAAGVLTVPAGVTGFSITLPTTQDLRDEANETVPVTVGGVAGTGTITDDDPTPSLAINNVSVNEAAGTMTFTVTLSAASGLPVSVGYATGNGTATAGADYTAGSGTLNFAPGVTSQTVTVAIAEDTVFEGSETLNVTLSGASNATIATATGVGTIVDNDAAPTLTVSSPTVGEAAGFAQFTVSLSNPSSTATSVNLALANGSASAADHGPGLEVSTDGGTTWTVATSATFAAGATSVLVRTPLVNDSLDELAETFTLTATTSAGSTTNASATGTATIVDDDATPSLSISDVTVNEAAGTATFTVTLSAASGLPVSVGYATSNGSATAPADYTAISGTLAFAPGVTSQTLTVAIANDTLFEGNETFNVTLSAPVNATVADGLGVATIVDNDAAPTIASVSSPTVTEGSDLVYAVTLSNASSTPTTFAYSLGGGSASAADIGTPTFSNGVTLAAGVLTVPAGVSGFSVTLPTTQDALDENSETVPLAIGGVSGTGTIVDDDATPSLAIDNVSVNEGAGTMTFTVTLSAASGLPVSVGYATGSGTATAGADYTAGSGTLSFAAGVTSQTVTVAIAEDTVFEGNETLNVTLSGATNATIGTATGIGTIVDNDAAPTLAVSSPTVGEAGGFAQFTVSLSNPSATATSVNLALANGSATGADYGPGLEVSTDGGTTWTAATAATFAAGATSVLVRTPVVSDALDENSEAFTLTATRTAGSTSNASAIGTATITDDDPTPSLAINNVSVNESAGTMTFTVTLSAASGLPVSVGYATGNGSAAAGSDYTAASGTLSFAAGVTSQTVTVAIADDTVFEGNETLNVTLSGATNATIGTATGIGTIVDNDAAPTLSVSSPTVGEAGGFAQFTVALSNPSSSATTVNLALANGSATGADYGPGLEVSTDGGTTWTAATSATFAAGATSVLVRTPVVNDVLDETSETFTLTATTSAGTTSNPSAAGTATITDDDPTPSLTINNVSVNESAGTMTFTVTLSAASGQAVSVDYATGNGTATAGSDYTAGSGTLTFAAGVTSQTVTVAIAEDTVFEGNESLNVTLSGASNATIATATGVGTIVDNDAAPTLAVSSPTVGEAGGFAQFTVSLSNPSSSATTVNLALANGSASGADYGPGLQVSTDGGTTWAAATSATFAAGATSVLVRTPVVNDALHEASETFTLTATTAAGTTSNAGAAGTATITDDDPTPSLAINNVSVNEGAGTMTFTVTLSAASGLPVSVGYATGNGTATAGADYTAGSGTLSFAAGVTSQTVTVAIAEDTVFEGNETLNVTLSSATNATIATAVGTGTIVDNDAAPTLTVSSPTVAEGGGFAVFTLALSNPSATATSFNLALANGSAGAADYGPALEVSSDGGSTWTSAGSATIAAGTISVLVRTPIANDSLDENNESFTLTATTSAGTTSNASAVGTATITDDDPTPSLAINNVSVNEAAGTMTFTVTLSAASGLPVSVGYATGNGTAAAGADYTAGSGTRNFAAGVTSQTVTVAIAEDSVFEGNETLNVTLSGAVNATIATPTGTGTIVDNDTAPTVTAVSSPSVTEGADLVYAVTLSNASSTATTFAFGLGGGSASAADVGGATFSNGVTLAAGVLTVPAGVTAFSITLPTVNDVLDEASETVPISVGGFTGIGTIVDNDPTPTLAINDVSVNESAGTMSFTVTLSAASGQAVSVNYATGNGTAIAGSDYTAAAGTVTFTPGQTSQTITVPISNDTVSEPAETLYVNLSSPSNATIADGLGVGTIIDNDAAPTVSTVSAAAVTEGGSLVHTVTLSNAASTTTTLAYSLAGGTATAGTDYNATPAFSNGVTLSGGVLSVPAGVTSFTVTVASTADVIDEPNETYNLSVGGVAAVGTINDDDATPTLSVSNVTVFETSGYAVFTVGLNGPSSSAVPLTLAFADGTATGGTSNNANSTTDYGNSTRMQVSTDGGTTWSALGTNTATIAAGQTSVLVRTYINNNNPANEPNETFTLTATTASGATTNTTATGTGTILEQDLSISSATIAEGGGTGVLTVTLNPALASATSFAFSLAGSATGTADYSTLTFSNGVTASGGNITIPAGITSFTISVPVVQDTLDEPSETVVVNIAGSNGTLTITDDDATPTLSINDVSVNEGAGTATFTVTLSAASGQTVTVNYSSVNQTALSGMDFSAVSGTLTFAPGTTTQTITVPIVNDNVYEGSETFRINLAAPSNATIADGIGIGTIADNGTGSGGSDNDTPLLAVSSITVSDQSAGFATFVVSLSNPSTVATSVSLALANGSATGGGVDYGASGATNIQVSTDNGATWTNATTATLAAGSSFVLVRTPIIADVANEVSETFTLTATRTAGTTTNASASGIGTITDIYNGPDAINDAPAAMLQEDTPTATVLAGNVIQGGAGNIADTDPNNDTLAVTGAVAGNSLVTGLVALGSPLTVSGTFGNLVIQADGTYTYTLDNARIQTQNMLGGQIYNDVFSYRVTDGNGGYDTATISVSITGTLDLTAITPQPVAIAADGLRGEYYGYNDGVVAGNRVHADDRSATALGTGANLESVEDISIIINGRNATMGGPNNIVGTSVAGATDAADVVFNVRTLNYGTTPVVSSNLGDNSAVAAGNALPPQDNITGAGTTTALANFLDQDAATARVQTGTPTGTTVGTQAGLGATTDAIIRMTGFVYLERGNYDFRVTGDDGFRLKVGGETLIEFDGNQSPTTRTFNNVEVNDRISGLTSIELLYWEQGGNANLQFEFKPSDSATWVPFSLDSIAFFSAATAPTLTDTRIQDIVETSVNQQYELRTGSVLDGDANTNTLTGAEGRDYIQGFGGDDILNGNGAADYLDGGIGNDVLNGGDGNDILIGGTGNDAMTGGLGDDIYRVDSAGDVVTELAGAGQGTDTVEIEATYNVGTYVIAANVENALLLGSFNSNITGNTANNRITGNDGSNVLVGGAGDDRILGGMGNDTLSGDAGPLAGGGVGKDIFEWNLADRGAAGAPAIDRITDFTYSGSTTSSAVPSGDLTAQRTDSLDLRDLLQGESSTSLNIGATPNIGNLLSYLDVTVAGGDTTIRISSTGGFSGGTYAAGQEDQRIVLTGVDLFTATGTTTETELLQRLLANGTLVVD